MTASCHTPQDDIGNSDARATRHSENKFRGSQRSMPPRFAPTAVCREPGGADEGHTADAPGGREPVLWVTLYGEVLRGRVYFVPTMY